MPSKPKLIEKVCAYCNKPFLAEARKVRRGQGKYCCQRCANTALAPTRRRQNQTGEKNPNWRGGRTIHSKGYVYTYAPGHPRASNGYVFEHILTAEKKLGRYLEDGETCHHINGRRWDNRLKNIQVFATVGEHTKEHWARGDYGRDGNMAHLGDGEIGKCKGLRGDITCP